MQPRTRRDGPLKGTARLRGGAPGYLPRLASPLLASAGTGSPPAAPWQSRAGAGAVPKIVARGGVRCGLSERGSGSMKSRR